MFFLKAADKAPSLLVEDGTTVTLSAEAPGPQVLMIRPRTIAALKQVWGAPVNKPVRLSDESAFERVHTGKGYVDITKPDAERRIGGHTTPFLRNVVRALDPDAPMPTSTVRGQVPHSNTSKASLPATTKMANVSYEEAFHTIVEVPIPRFLRDFSVIARLLVFDDVIIGFNSTLVFSSNIWVVLASNILAYDGSRIVQQGQYFSLDVTGTMRGSIQSIVHNVNGVGEVSINWHQLKELPVKKL